jgi:predicted Zn-ribbon and HTH transcriptional regulator
VIILTNHSSEDKNMSGKITLPHKCPKCGVVAKTEPELLKIFGYRTKDGGITNQSQCKKCR